MTLTAQQNNDWFAATFETVTAMAILRGFGTDRSLELARTAWSVGITSVEVPIQGDDDVAALAAVVDAGKMDGRLVGAGTVLTVDDVRAAADAGAAFTVSPGLDADVVAASLDAGLPTLPGIATATEIQRGLSLGLTWMKAFPAAVLGTGWFTAMRGPFPRLNLVATGGLNATNLPDYLAAGARVGAVGSALADPEQLRKLAAALAR